MREKTAETKHTKDELILNTAYQDLEEFYDVVILPPPARKPKGKPTHTLNESLGMLLITSTPKTEKLHHFRHTKTSEEWTSTSKGEYYEKYTVDC